MRWQRRIILSFGALLVWGCASSPGAQTALETTAVQELVVSREAIESAKATHPVGETATPEPVLAAATSTPKLALDKTSQLADVISVQTSGRAGAYQFSVTIRSPDTGCEQYADWWEVVGEGGELIYRRILLHSHVGEQPFERSGGAVAVQPDTITWVRAHMHPGGYGGLILKGSVQQGFSQVQHPVDFALELDKEAPLPEECAF